MRVVKYFCYEQPFLKRKPNFGLVSVQQTLRAVSRYIRRPSQ